MDRAGGAPVGRTDSSTTPTGPAVPGSPASSRSPTHSPSQLFSPPSRTRRASPRPSPVHSPTGRASGLGHFDTTATCGTRDFHEGGDREKVYDVPVSYAGPQWPRSGADDDPRNRPETAGHSPRHGGRRASARRMSSFFCQTPEKLDRGGDLCVVMVGLPGRGKTYYAHKLCRYINWLGINTKCFLVSEYLRQARYMDERGLAKFRADYFDPANEDAIHERMSALQEALIDIRGYLTREDGQVAILDGQATTLRVRTSIHESLTTLMTGRRVIYLEIVMDNQRAEELYDLKVRSVVAPPDGAGSQAPPMPPVELHTPPGVVPACLASGGPGSVSDMQTLGTECGEYAGMTLEEAVEDFRQRVQIFEQDYVPLAPGMVHNALEGQRALEDGGTGVALHQDDSVYIRLIDGGTFGKTKYEVTGVRGFLPSRLVNWLFNLSPSHRLKHPIFFCRHGQSEFNIADRIGGDPQLTQRGQRDAQLIAEWFLRQGYTSDQLEIWTSRLKRTIETARPLQDRGFKTLRWRALNEIHAGICEGLTYAEVKAEFPFIETWRKEDKYTFRYPEGESYQDLVTRLEPVLMELECAEQPVLVVSHQAVLRCMFAYFEESAAETATNIVVPQATVWEYNPTGQGVGQLRHYCLREMADITGLTEMTFCPEGQSAAAQPGAESPAPAPLLPSS